MDYRQERERQEIAWENDYRTTDGAESDTRITFKSFLVGRAGRRFVGR